MAYAAEIMIMPSVRIDASWDEHVQGFKNECLISKGKAGDSVDNMSGLGLTGPSDSMGRYGGSRIPDGSCL